MKNDANHKLDLENFQLKQFGKIILWVFLVCLSMKGDSSTTERRAQKDKSGAGYRKSRSSIQGSFEAAVAIDIRERPGPQKYGCK